MGDRREIEHGEFNKNPPRRAPADSQLVESIPRHRWTPTVLSRRVFWIIKKKEKKKKRETRRKSLTRMHARAISVTCVARYHIPAVPFAPSVRCELIVAGAYARSFARSLVRFPPAVRREFNNWLQRTGQSADQSRGTGSKRKSSHAFLREHSTAFGLKESTFFQIFQKSGTLSMRS